MSQVIVGVDLNKYMNQLGLARRMAWGGPQDGQRQHQIAKCLSTPDELALAANLAYWNWRVEIGEPMGVGLDRARNRTARFNADEVKYRLTFDGSKCTGGYMVLRGTLHGLWTYRRGSGEWLLQNAIDDGAVRLDCFDIPHLIKLYTAHGFREVRRELNEVRGLPDVVWMERHVATEQ